MKILEENLIILKNFKSEKKIDNFDWKQTIRNKMWFSEKI